MAFCEKCNNKVLERDIVTVCVARQTHQSPAEYQEICRECVGPEYDRDEAYERAERSEAWEEARRRRAVRTWCVVTPEYGTLIPIVDGQGPMEYGCDVAWVEAETRRDAVVLGVKLMRDRGDRYFDDADNPFTGVRAIESPRCEHGRGEWERCVECERDGD